MLKAFVWHHFALRVAKQPPTSFFVQLQERPMEGLILL